jgi:MFS family permease
VALAAVFVVFGALGGNWDARLPAVRDRLSLDSGELGVVIFAVLLAATAILPLAGWLTARLGTRGPSALGLLCAGAGITAAAFVPSYASLLPAACVIGAGWGIVDVASNAHGVAVEQALGRRILSGLHSAWSFGLLAGSGIAAGAAAASIGPRVQFPVVAAAAAIALAVARPSLRPTLRTSLFHGGRSHSRQSSCSAASSWKPRRSAGPPSSSPVRSERAVPWRPEASPRSRSPWESCG